MFKTNQEFEEFELQGEEATITRRNFISKAAVGAAIAGVGAFALSGCVSEAAADDSPTATSGTETVMPVPTGEYQPQPLLATYAEPPLETIETKAANVKKLLVVVDYQVDFVDGAFGPNPLAISLDKALHDRIVEFRDRGDVIIYTMDTHPLENYTLTREGSRLQEHCVLGTPGWELYGTVKEVLSPETAYVVRKGTFGSRVLPDLINELKSQGLVFDTIEMAGVSTSACVFHNAVILYNYFPEAEIVLNKATTAARDEESTEAALAQFEGWGCKIIR